MTVLIAILGPAALGTWRRAEIQHRQHPARLQRLHDAGVHRLGIGEVVVGVAHEHGIAALLAETGVLRLAGDNRHVLQPGAVHSAGDLLHPFRVDLVAEDAAGVADRLRNQHGELAVAGAKLRDDAAWPQVEGLHHALRIGGVRRRVLRCWSGDDGQREDERCDEPMEGA